MANREHIYIYIHKHKALDKRQQLTGADTFSIPCQNLHGNLLAFISNTSKLVTFSKPV